MTCKIQLNFYKPTVSKGVIDLLQNGLVEDADQSKLSKLTLKECLSFIAQGKKLQNAPANYLLVGLLRMLSIEDSPIEDEIPPGGLQEEKDTELGKDRTLTQLLGEGTSKDNANPNSNSNAKDKDGTPVPEASNKDLTNHSGSTKKKEVCCFYTNGRCRRGQDCRFDHPAICKKFRKSGSKSNDSNGCDGKCKAFHPNACRNSLRNRTCSFKECRFYHLKGTKFLNKGNNQTQNQPSNQNWRSSQNQNQNRNDQNQNRNWNNQNLNLNNQSRQKGNRNGQSNQNLASKNRFASLDNSQNQDPSTPPAQIEQPPLAATLEAIMSRLSAMEARQAQLPMPQAPTPPVYPLLSPAVPQPGTQTQRQWGSQNQWTQSQF